VLKFGDNNPWLNPKLPPPAGGSMTPQIPEPHPAPPAPPSSSITPLPVPKSGPGLTPTLPGGVSSAPVTPLAVPKTPAPYPFPPQNPDTPIALTSPHGGAPYVPKPLTSPTPVPSAVAGAPPGWNGPAKFTLQGDQAQKLLDLYGQFQQKVAPGLPPPGAFSTASITDKVPPLSRYTSNLGSFQAPADKALGWIQNQLRGPQGPQTFASFASMLGKPVVEGALNTPFGLPLLAGGYGLLRGGESFAAAKHLFGPALQRMGAG
jgi:hypothetical protein